MSSSAKPAHQSQTADKRKAIIISGFAAIGKTVFSKDAKVHKSTGMNVIDLDSSLYSKDPSFPRNYEVAIRKAAEQPCIILISTHQGLPTQLTREGYYVALVYPGGGLDAKNEWLSRLRKREKGGQKSSLYTATDKYWEVWYNRTTGERVTFKLTLSNNDYLGNVFDSIYNHFKTIKTRSR